jgi:para-nitrobenzyl esterase
MTEPMIERLLAGAEPGERERITAAYPGYPDPVACIQFGGDFAFGSAAWQIAEAHSLHAPTYLYRYDYAPRRCAGRARRHACHRSCRVFDVYRTKFGRLLTAAVDGAGVAGQRRRAVPLARVLPHGVPGEGWPAYTSADRAVWCSTVGLVSSTTRTPTAAAWEGFSLADG